LKEVLDTRFFVEHFYSDDPSIKARTQNRLRDLQREERGVLPTIVISEIVNLTCERKGKDDAELRYLSLVRSGLEVSDLSAEIAKRAGLLKCSYRKLPYGDSIISATALLLRAAVVSDDPHFNEVKALKVVWI